MHTAKQNWMVREAEARVASARWAQVAHSHRQAAAAARPHSPEHRMAVMRAMEAEEQSARCEAQADAAVAEAA